MVPEVAEIVEFFRSSKRGVIGTYHEDEPLKELDDRQKQAVKV